MSNEAISRQMMDLTPNTNAYEVIETTDTLASAIEQLTTADVVVPANSVCGQGEQEENRRRAGREQEESKEAPLAGTLALVTITLYFEAEGKLVSGPFASTNPHPCAVFLMNSLRPLVRKTDAVFLRGHTLHFLLLGADLQGGEIVQTRLWDALLWRIHNTTEGEVPRPDSMAIGHSAYPVPDSHIDEFIEAAGVVNLRCNYMSEKSVRKTTARQARTAQLDAGDEEWPALARKLGIPYLSLLPRKPPERVQQLVNTRLAQELRCYPVGRERNMLTVAMLNPRDRVALERLHRETGLDIYPVLTHPQELKTALEQLV